MWGVKKGGGVKGTIKEDVQTFSDKWDFQLEEYKNA